MICPSFSSLWVEPGSSLLIPQITEETEDPPPPILLLLSCPVPLDDVIEKQIEDGLLRPELRERVSYVLLRKHRHQTTKPIHRSLADIGKSVSSPAGEWAMLVGPGQGAGGRGEGVGVRPWAGGRGLSPGQ